MIKIIKHKTENTRDRILEKSIDLFEKKGYESVTIREIASSVGIKGSSIYNHFSSKENILEEILEYHRARLSENYNNDQVKHKLNKILEKSDLKIILTEILLIALGGIEDPSLKKVLKILSAEQLKNDIVREYFYKDYLLAARGVIKGIFDILKQRGVLRYEDTEFLANEFHAFIIYKYYEHFMLKQDYKLDVKAMLNTFTKHISFFVDAVSNY